jgi:uncharacterized delta-60 repeat protein
MSRIVVVPVIARRKAGRPGTMAALMRVWGRGSVVAVLMTLSLVLFGEARPGDLYPTFGVGGKVTTDFGGTDAATALILQPDGKLVAAGFSRIGIGGVPVEDFALARYQPDGSLDASFGVGGKVTTDFGESSDLANALVLQPDGKLVVAGVAGGTGVSGFFDFALARYRPDGSLDASFGMGGKVTTDLGGGDEAFALVLQPDGKLVVAGSTGVSTNAVALARYLPDGSLDPTFGTDGKVIDIEDAGEARALVLQPDGKLVAAGFSQVGPDFGDFALARYRPDGSLDPTFGVGGKVTTDFGDQDFAFALVLQSDGKLVAAGTSQSLNVPDDFALARYLLDGSLDPTFGTGFEIIVNTLVTFEPIPSSFTFTPDPAGCPEGFAGKFSFEAQLTNSSEHSLSALVIAVTALTNGNLLQNADGGPGGVGVQLTVPEEDGFADGVLSPEEFVDVPFIICLQERQPFAFLVNVLGVVEAGADAQAKALP